MCHMKLITVLLAEDHTLMREGLRALLANEGDIDVVGEAETGRQAVHLTQMLSPDVVVMDISMPLLNGLEAARQIHRTVPSARVLILSAHSGQAYVEQAVALGAVGYVTKQTTAGSLCSAIRVVHRGGTVLNPGPSERHDDCLEKPPDEAKPSIRIMTELASRDVEVLQLVAESMCNKQIAAELGLSAKTVEKHRDHLMRQLNIHDTASLTRCAVAAGIIEVNILA